MTDLERQLRGYATAVLDRVDPVRAEQIVQAHPWRRHHRRVGLALVLVGVLAVGLAVTMWAATRGTGPAITTTTRVGAPLPTSWSRVSAFPTSGAEAATSSGGRVVVVGGGGIFFSGDARTWTSVLDTAPVGEVNAVITDGSGFVAAGDAPDPAGGRPGALAAIWTSPDGQDWTRVQDPALEPSTPAIPAGDTTPVPGSIRGLSRGGPGFVAVGGVFAGSFVGRELVGPPDAPAVWISPDAKHWTRVNTGTAFGPESQASSLELTGVARAGHSLILAAQQGSVTTFFASSDARHWRSLGTVSGAVTKIVDYRGQLVAVGSQGGSFGAPQRAAIWTSRDGTHWQRVLVTAPTSLTSFNDVTTNNQSLVAVGYRGTQEPIADAIMVISQDAHTWQSVPPDGQPFASRTGLDAVTLFEGNYLAFGTEITGGTGSAASPIIQDTAVFTSVNPDR